MSVSPKPHAAATHAWRSCAGDALVHWLARPKRGHGVWPGVRGEPASASATPPNRNAQPRAAATHQLTPVEAGFVSPLPIIHGFRLPLATRCTMARCSFNQRPALFHPTSLNARVRRFAGHHAIARSAATINNPLCTLNTWIASDTLAVGPACEGPKSMHISPRLPFPSGSRGRCHDVMRESEQLALLHAWTALAGAGWRWIGGKGGWQAYEHPSGGEARSKT